MRQSIEPQRRLDSKRAAVADEATDGDGSRLAGNRCAERIPACRVEENIVPAHIRANAEAQAPLPAK